MAAVRLQASSSVGRTNVHYTFHATSCLDPCRKRKLRSDLAKCVICIRSRARPSNQVMAPLPVARVTPSRPFSKTGLDYVVPFQILSAKGRGIRSTKGYIVVLVCFATKMLHLELVGDMTTDSLMGALTRLFSRRGKPSEMWSDNGTYFHRADFELRVAFESAQLDWTGLSGSLAIQGVTWHFIPPEASSLWRHLGSRGQAG
ncbi:uncharacterized protein LOC117173582 [Belonocnema kinseyi]|uniref:uncharacterized protein LOC117173582 n=1 Tax=Belonocnema kinseyi TaxID=2817044 RepID=UPI00143CD342|nr:uncharacterized protein LOC117173582 [Belonocnema kinseyi]